MGTANGGTMGEAESPILGVPGVPGAPPDRIAAAGRAVAVVPTPPSSADMQAWEEAFRKQVAAAMMDPACVGHLIEGLQAKDPKERRLWWQMAAEIVKGGKEAALDGGGFKVIFENHVPAPAHEDGPLGRAKDVTPRA